MTSAVRTHRPTSPNKPRLLDTGGNHALVGVTKGDERAPLGVVRTSLNANTQGKEGEVTSNKLEWETYAHVAYP